MARQTGIPEVLPANATAAQARVWVHRLVRLIGPGFHPDTPFSDYTDQGGMPLFASVERAMLEKGLAAACQTLNRAGIDVYAVALPVQRLMLTSR